MAGGCGPCRQTMSPFFYFEARLHTQAIWARNAGKTFAKHLP